MFMQYNAPNATDAYAIDRITGGYRRSRNNLMGSKA